VTVAVATLGSQVIHGTDSFGVRWSMQRDQFAGWDDSAGVDGAVVQRSRAAGAWGGTSYDQAAHPSFGGLVFAATPADLLAARDRLKAACSLTDTTLTVDREGSVRSMTVRREDAVLFKPQSPTVAAWSIQLVALDPRKLGAMLTASTALPSSSGGLTVPYTIPTYTIASTVVTGQVALTNAGNVTGPVRLRIDGPVTGPVVTHVGSGLALTFATSLVLGSGEWLEVDMDKRTALANGQSSRAGYITGRGWSGFEPGANVWAFTAQSYSAGALLTVSASPAWA